MDDKRRKITRLKLSELQPEVTDRENLLLNQIWILGGMEAVQKARMVLWGEFWESAIAATEPTCYQEEFDF